MTWIASSAGVGGRLRVKKDKSVELMATGSCNMKYRTGNPDATHPMRISALVRDSSTCLYAGAADHVKNASLMGDIFVVSSCVPNRKTLLIPQSFPVEIVVSGYRSDTGSGVSMRDR
jgi:hypothetical protein